MGSIGVPEMLIGLVIVLILFGSSRLPKLGRSVGEAIGALRSSIARDEASDE